MEAAFEEIPCSNTRSNDNDIDHHDDEMMRKTGGHVNYDTLTLDRIKL